MAKRKRYLRQSLRTFCFSAWSLTVYVFVWLQKLLDPLMSVSELFIFLVWSLTIYLRFWLQQNFWTLWCQSQNFLFFAWSLTVYLCFWLQKKLFHLLKCFLTHRFLGLCMIIDRFSLIVVTKKTFWRWKSFLLQPKAKINGQWSCGKTKGSETSKSFFATKRQQKRRSSAKRKTISKFSNFFSN